MEKHRKSSIKFLCDVFKENNYIDPELYTKFDVKRGLRNADGTGVIAGLTNICNVHGYIIDDGEKKAVDGDLIYRGINIKDIIDGCEKDDRFGFEEVIWLLLFGKLPNKNELDVFTKILFERRELPENFCEDMILKAPSSNIMNKLARSVLALYSYDDEAENTSVDNVLRQSIELIAQMPTIMVSAFQVKKRHFDHESMYFHPPIEGQSMAEHILSTLRSDRIFTKEEAKLLDLCLILHAEHGGGNNSTFSCRVLSSSGTDTYSAISAAIGSLKGPRHGGANIKVLEMLAYLKSDISDYSDESIKNYLRKLLKKEAGDKSGLIYGMGHAVYTVSDPRALILKHHAKNLVEEKGFTEDFLILDAIERLAPSVVAESKTGDKAICANVDLYSGMVYRMLGISPDLYTPLFAISRTSGWCAHRIEEMLSNKRIIRPAYKSVADDTIYSPLNQR